MLSKFSRQQEDSAKWTGPSSLGEERNHKQEGGEARSMLETSEPLLLVLRFGKVDWSLSEAGCTCGAVCEGKCLRSICDSHPHPRGNGAFPHLGGGSVCLGDILLSPSPTEIPGRGSAFAQIGATAPWALSFHAKALRCLLATLRCLAKDGGRF